MKKAIISLILAIVMVFSVVPLRLNKAQAEALFTEGEIHTFTLECRQYFETMSANEGPCTVIVQKDIYEEARAQASWDTIMADLQALSSATEITLDDFKPITIYLVKGTPTGVERYENRLYCTMTDVESGAYRVALISAALGTEEYWKAYGVASYLRGDKADEARLKAAYEQAYSLDGLSLFISYFNETFASEEEIHLAEQTAMAVARYVLENHGGKALVEEDCINYRQEWLTSLGIDRVYDDPLYVDLQDYRFSSSTQYPLIATNSHEHAFYILPLRDIQTAEDVRHFLYDAAAGTKAILAFVKEQAPEFYETINNFYKGKLNIYCNTERTSRADYYQRAVWLQTGSAYPHEIGHILIPPPSDHYSESSWHYQGICDYFSEILCPTYSQMNRYLNALSLYGETGDAEGEGKSTNADYRKFMARVTEIYLNNAELPSSIEELDKRLFLQSQALVPMRYPDEVGGCVLSWPHYMAWGGKNVQGNELTSLQGCSFAMYLIDQYSLSAYLRYCGKISFDEAFGISYEQAKADWLDALMSEIR